MVRLGGWALAALLIVGCSLGGGRDGERWLMEVSESAVAAFVRARDDARVPAGPLTCHTPAICSSEALPGPRGPRMWEVRQPHAEAVQVPHVSRDQQAADEFKADVVMLYQERWCELAASGAPTRCEPWQPARCCAQVWTMSRGEWRAEPPPARQ